MSVRVHYLYWACQIIGWGSYSVIVFAVTTASVGWHPTIAVGFLLFFFYSVALTHLLRGEIRRRNWLTLPAARGLPRIFSSAIVTGLVQATLVIVLSRALAGANSFDSRASFGTLSGVTFVTCIWAALYVGISWNRRYRQAQFREMQLELTLRQAELRELQAQINPHFLFNCLNTIRGMITADPGRAQEMITSLASLLRRSLQSTSAQIVPLSEEMDAVADYLELEAMRFEERLQISLEIGEQALACTVPAMLVQTLVENAVKHGISQLPAGGTVRVQGTRESESLVVKVENNGSIREPDPNGKHIGLDNARERLRLFYGERASLELSDRDGWVIATVVIPQRV